MREILTYNRKLFNNSILLSWTKYMTVFHSFCETLYNRTIREAKVHDKFVFLFSSIYFICIQIFNNCRRKFLKISLDSAWKYATRFWNERVKKIIMNERSDWISFHLAKNIFKYFLYILNNKKIYYMYFNIHNGKSFVCKLY